MTSRPTLEMTGVSVSYGSRRVLDHLDLTIHRGTVLGLLGLNGAGKSTLISVAAGLLQPHSGHVLVEGLDISRKRLSAASRIGLAPQRLGVYPTLSARQNLMIFAELARLRGRAARRRVDEVLATLDLDAQSELVVGELSGGQQRRVHTGMALVSRPRLLFLDEPTVGADVESRRRILRAVRSLADDGTAVLYTSHVLSEFEELRAEIAVLHGGRISARGSIPQLVRDHAETSVELRFRHDAPTLRGWRRLDRSALVRSGGASPGADLTDAIGALAAQPGSVDDLVDVSLRRPDLDDVFRSLTGIGWTTSADGASADPAAGSATTSAGAHA
ncbi:ABC transporter ATP-binding protein [Homoserinibacter sp. YIM 151385]|uniref:ABC transporter ATP-binding protein n=1 Tax=Homoserinibacter sp. YIM 151385 TaxID=2985506 RepID=UPI0022F0C0E3|nr:ABC transporter ATP-binding protein [Homoserinibacter sp. YIM 151385]WBU38791.1 ABC transporter ATP-binding protein [Homoserinibacter sp. YIM 151385]